MSRFFLLFALVFFNKPGFADYEITLTELMQMPPFCRGLSPGNFAVSAREYRKSIKVPGQHTQHFCHGMKSIIRRKYKTAVREFEYVQHHSTRQHELIPATSLYKAEALSHLKKYDEALTEYNAAITLKPNYSVAYAKLADFYLLMEHKDKAIETLKTGLENSPNSKLLNKKLYALQKK